MSDLTVMNCPMLEGNDFGAKTVGEALRNLLLKLYEEGERFNSKRPYGNSGWDYDLAIALHLGGFVDGRYDQNTECYEDIDCKKADKLIKAAIKSLFVE